MCKGVVVAHCRFFADLLTEVPLHPIGRLLALSEGEIAALTTSMRQIGVGTPGGAEALAIFHQLFYDEWMTGSLGGPLASGIQS